MLFIGIMLMVVGFLSFCCTLIWSFPGDDYVTVGSIVQFVLGLMMVVGGAA